MKTAEEILKEKCKYFELGITEEEAINAMKQYAALVSIETLNTAISNLDDSMVDFGGTNETLKFTILSTQIKTP